MFNSICFGPDAFSNVPGSVHDSKVVEWEKEYAWITSGAKCSFDSTFWELNHDYLSPSLHDALTLTRETETEVM